MIVQAVLAGQELIAVRAVQADEFLFENLIAVDPRLRLRALLLLLHLPQVITLDVAVQVIFHLEQAVAVRAGEHVAPVQLLVDRAHVIFHAVQAREGFEAQLALRDAIGWAEEKIGSERNRRAGDGKVFSPQVEVAIFGRSLGTLRPSFSAVNVVVVALAFARLADGFFLLGLTQRASFPQLPEVLLQNRIDVVEQVKVKVIGWLVFNLLLLRIHFLLHFHTFIVNSVMALRRLAFLVNLFPKEIVGLNAFSPELHRFRQVFHATPANKCGASDAADLHDLRNN